MLKSTLTLRMNPVGTPFSSSGSPLPDGIHSGLVEQRMPSQDPHRFDDALDVHLDLEDHEFLGPGLRGQVRSYCKRRFSSSAA